MKIMGLVGDLTPLEETVESDSERVMASRGRRGGVPDREGKQRREEQAEQQALAPQGHVVPPPPPVDYGVFMQGLVQAMQTQAHTQAALQAQLEAQTHSLLRRTGLVGDPTPLEETVECDSERGE
ncbi:hypothetical protein Taro_017430 [Colocasia esculenta]|uniref:Uncharacterized protein n=1 Tax=Colocasia esculenta TaxID=4460 RepID=A0A843UT90_COLES|nr:hypothetical protein [Colocasia esculenta]